MKVALLQAVSRFWPQNIVSSLPSDCVLTAKLLLFFGAGTDFFVLLTKNREIFARGRRNTWFLCLFSLVQTTRYSVLTAVCLLILRRMDRRQKICDFHKLFLSKSLTFYKSCVKIIERVLGVGGYNYALTQHIRYAMMREVAALLRQEISAEYVRF